MATQRVMRLVFRGGAVVDVPLGPNSEVMVERSSYGDLGGYTAINWGEKHPDVQLISMCPEEVVGVFVMKVKA